MSINIRKATQQDFPTILSLIHEFALFQKTPERIKVTLEQMIADQHLFECFVAETATKEVVGYASAYFVYNSWTGKGLYLDDLYVQEAYRKLGLGKLLIEKVIALAREEQCKKVRWLVSSWNEMQLGFTKN